MGGRGRRLKRVHLRGVGKADDVRRIAEIGQGFSDAVGDQTVDVVTIPVGDLIELLAPKRRIIIVAGTDLNPMHRLKVRVEFCFGQVDVPRAGRPAGVVGRFQSEIP